MSAAAPEALFDAHAHLQAHQFDGDRDAAWQRALAAGLCGAVCASDDLVSSLDSVALAERVPGINAAVGVHPHEAAGFSPEAARRLEQLCASAAVVAIGETGLDYYRDLSPRPVQRAAFTSQLELAERLGLPVVIHSREAADDTLAILEDWGASRRTGPHQMHCFGYDAAYAERFLALGFMISIPGTVTYPNAGTLRAVAACVPEDMLTVETDCPYLSPQSRRGRRNEPAFIGETVAKVAELRCVEAAHLARVTTENARRLFRLAQDDALQPLSTRP